jgi:hypothetical protein
LSATVDAVVLHRRMSLAMRAQALVHAGKLRSIRLELFKSRSFVLRAKSNSAFSHPPI